MKYRLFLFILVILGLMAGLLWWGHGHKAKRATPVVSNHKSASTAPTFNKQRYSLTDPTSLWIVVNKNLPLVPASYAPADLVNVGNGQLMRAEAAAAFAELMSAAKSAGYSTLAESGYRSYQTQQAVYNREVQSFGQAKADTESARPGYSEHQTGWAVDIQSPGCQEDCFGKTTAASWLAAHAYEYGFILRYTPAKIAITGYRSEPWHFRYVGKDLASQLQQTSQTLEEFFGLPAVGTP